jgi:phytoene desaturase
VVAGADYHHIDKQVLSKNHSNYSDKYWDKRVMAPSSVLYYLGVNKKIKKLTHHTLFFDTDFKQHAKEIYDTKEWPSNPLFYVCTPSVTDVSVAPQNNENIFLLMPVATGLTDDTEATREKYFDMMMTRLEKYCGEKIREHIIVKKSYAQSNFINDYNSFKGNAYGLANTLMQTAILKPSLKNKHLNNFYYTGQLTSPGPGVPPAIISGEVVSNLILAEI